MSDKQHFTIVRNAGYGSSEFKTRQRHNERQNENYHNGDIISERSALNFHYCQYAFPDGTPVTYEERFNQLLAADIIAKRGLKPDAIVFAELVFGVNSEYFEQNGGYEFAKKFFDEVYNLAVKEVGDERYILSAVLHADERNYAEFDPPALLFELRDGFRWVGVDADISAEDLFNKSKKKRGRPAGKGNDVKTEILRLLDGGVPMPSAELEATVCELTGCHPNTVTAAKKELGVVSYQSGRQWFSVLRGQGTIIRQDTINTPEG